MAYRVLIPQAVAREGVDYLKERGYEVIDGSGTTEEDLIRDVKDCDAILLRTAVVSRAVLEAGTKLRIVARHGAGYNNVDLKAAEELGIWVTNAPDSTTNTVAEFTLGALIALAKRSMLMSSKLHAGDYWYKNTHKGTDLIGKTLSVVGFGRIGREVAKKAHYGLGMKILAYDPKVRTEDTPDYVEIVDWERAFSEADFVTLHMPLTATNRGSIGEKEFLMMKPEAQLINCARGEVVDQKALTAALRKGEIAGAFLDVLEQEPPAPDDPLLSMENVILTPHMASNTEECMALMATQAASQIHRVLSGEMPDWPVNRPESPRAL